jgi:hypothetical protein
MLTFGTCVSFEVEPPKYQSSPLFTLGRFEEADPERAEGANATRKSKEI